MIQHHTLFRLLSGELMKFILTIKITVTVADTFAVSYLPIMSLEAGSAADQAASLKIKKYEELSFSFRWHVRSRQGY